MSAIASSQPTQSYSISDLIEFANALQGEDIDDTVKDVVNEVFGKKSLLPKRITSLIGSYIPDEAAYISTQSTLLDFVNLSNPEVLKSYLKTLSHYTALDIAKRVYETSMRNVAGTAKYGYAFPMNPEVLAYAMQHAKGKTVLEIAGASGENGILLAFAGANRVYVNDIESSEMESFRKLRKDLPKGVRSKLEAIEGDCLDILTKKPEIINKIDLLLCRNLIHFFNNEQQDIFFKMLEKTLVPGGLAIFTTNSVYVHSTVPDIRQTVERNPNTTTFEFTQCCITNYEKSSSAFAQIFTQISPRSDDQVSLAGKEAYLYQRTAQTGNKWKAFSDQFSLLDASIRPKIQEACKNNKDLYAPLKAGSVRVLSHINRLYTTATLPELFKRMGFDPICTFVVSKDGHLISEVDPFTNGQQMGIIVRKPA